MYSLVYPARMQVPLLGVVPWSDAGFPAERYIGMIPCRMQIPMLGGIPWWDAGFVYGMYPLVACRLHCWEVYLVRMQVPLLRMYSRSTGQGGRSSQDTDPCWNVFPSGRMYFTLLGCAH